MNEKQIKFSVKGMSCAACQSRVENAASKVFGVKKCSVNLLTNTLLVEGNCDVEQIIGAVQDAGYSISLFKNLTSDFFENKEIKILRNRLVFSGVFLFVLFYMSTGYNMWNFPLPVILQNSKVLLVCQGVLSFVIMLINRKFFINGIKSLFKGSPNMDTLVALGSGVSFCYLYFESAAMIVTLITVGKLLEAISKGKTTNALKSLINLSSKTAVVIKNNTEVEIPIDELKIGDIFVVKPGEKICADGTVIYGNSAVDESTLTGESIPKDKYVGCKVYASTLNTIGYLKCQVDKVGQETVLAQIIQLISDATSTKAPIGKIADKVSGIFVPVVLLISILTFFVWIVLGKEISFALNHSIAVLVVSCPCALGLATPVAIMVGSGKGAKNGILFKTSASLEETGRCKIVVLDKTGTITKGEPVVDSIIPNKNITEKELLEYATSLEIKSEHPLAKAIIKKGKELQTETKNILNFEIIPGKGLKANFENKKLIGGNKKFLLEENVDFDSFETKIEDLLNQGKTLLYFALEKQLLGAIAVSDTIKDDSKNAIQMLKNLGLEVFMLTGDNEKTAKYIAKEVGIEHVVSSVLPNEKDEIIRKLQSVAKVIMVGDGINDAPALTRANIGIAIGAGTDIAMEAADIVLIKNKLSDVVKSIILSKKTIGIICQNLFWAFFYNILLIPVAVGAYNRFGIYLSPVFGALAMSLSSFSVVLNALRLNLLSINKTKMKNNKIDIKIIEKEIFNMKKTYNVEGMMCCHCENHVIEALRKISGVENVVASHEKKQVEVTMNKDIPDTDIITAIEGEGYKVL